MTMDVESALAIRNDFDDAMRRDRVHGYLTVGLGPVEVDRDDVELGLVVLYDERRGKSSAFPERFRGLPVRAQPAPRRVVAKLGSRA